MLKGRCIRIGLGAILALGLAGGCALPVRADEGALGGDKSVVRRVDGHLTMENVPESVPADISDKLDQYSNVRSAMLGGFDPSGKGMLIYTRLSDTTQVHRVKSPGAYREQLTFFNEPVHEIIVNPNAAKNSMIILKDIGGNESYQLYKYDFASGSSKLLTNGKARYGSVVWSPDGAQIAYQSTERNGADWDIWIMDPEHPESARMVYSPGGYWCVMDWSPDGSKLLVYKYVSITDSYMEILDIKTGKTLPVGLTAEERKKIERSYFALGEQAKFSPDGRGVFFTTDRYGEFQSLCYQDIATGKISALAPDVKGGVVSIQISPDGKTLAFVTNEEGLGKVYVCDIGSGSCNVRQIKSVDQYVVYEMKFYDNDSLALSLGSGNLPCDTYTVSIRDGAFKQWTFSEVGGLNIDKFSAPKLIHYPTFDKVGGKQREIPAFCYMPKDIGNKPCPVLIYIHGGPESQYTPYFSSLIQYLATEQKIAVIAPNVRGSYGYGKTYVQLDNGYLRENSVKDIGALIDWINAQPEFNGRIAVMGGSYGGYMTLASMTHYSDKLSCGVDNVGISNFVTFLENTNENRKDLRRVEYGDERDPEMRAFMEKIAPANNAAKISKPLYVVQGKNDPRVPVTEAEQMVREIRRAGGTVWYLCADNEGHGFAKKTNRDFYWQTAVMFLQKYLKGE
ncbi:S9 family peptidase [bacterium]|nr:S9 family peptidase [bacterium]